MREILRTNDPVRLSFILALLRDAGLEPFVADQFTSVVEGSISAIPRRVMIHDEQAEAALKLIAENDVD